MRQHGHIKVYIWGKSTANKMPTIHKYIQYCANNCNVYAIIGMLVMVVVEVLKVSNNRKYKLVCAFMYVYVCVYISIL